VESATAPPATSPSNRAGHAPPPTNRHLDLAIAVLSWQKWPRPEIRRFLLSVVEFCDANPDIEELSINDAA
jgi:hypothetical protein